MDNPADAVAVEQVALMPCPRGHGAVRVNRTHTNFGERWYGNCCECAWSGPLEANETEAIAAWNTRSHSPRDAAPGVVPREPTEAMVKALLNALPVSTSNRITFSAAKRALKAAITGRDGGEGPNDATLRMAKTLGADFVPKGSTPPAPEVADIVERIKRVRQILSMAEMGASARRVTIHPTRCREAIDGCDKAIRALTDRKEP